MLLAMAELDSDTWVAEVKRIRGKKEPRPCSQPENFISPSASDSSVRSGMFIVTRPHKNLFKLR
jgi:hypothetical protein